MPVSALRIIVTEQGAQQAAARLSFLGAKVDSLGKLTGLSKFQAAGALAFTAVGAAAIKGLGAAVTATENLGASTRTLQRITGQSAEQASALVAIGHRYGLEVDKLNTGLGIFSKHLVDGGKAFEKYGISLTDASGRQKPFNELLAEASDRYLSLAPGIERTAFLMDVFGRSGRKLAPILNQGSEGLARLTKQAEEMGVVMSQDDVDATTKLAIAQRDLSEEVLGLKVGIGEDLIPVLTTLVHVGSDVIGVIQAIPGPVRTFFLLGAAGVGTLTGLGLAIKIIGTGLGQLKSSLGLAAAGEGELAAGAGVTTGALGVETGAIKAQTVALAARNRAALGIGTGAGAVLLGAIALSGDAAVQATQKFKGLTDAQREQAEEAVRGASAASKAWDFLVKGPLGELSLGAARDVLPRITEAAKVYRDELAKGVSEEQAMADAMASVGLAAAGTAADLDQSTEATDDQAEAAEQLASALAEMRPELSKLHPAFAGVAGDVSTFALITGQGFSSVKRQIGSLAAELQVAWESSSDDLSAFGGDWEKFLTDMRASVEQWHGQVVSAFDLSGPLSSLVSDSHLTIADINKAFTDQIRVQQRWSADTARILSVAGVSAKPFIASLASMGTEGERIADVLAHGTNKQIQDTVGLFNKGEAGAETLADKLQRQLVGSMHTLTRAFEVLISKISGIPLEQVMALIADTGPARQSVHNLIVQLQGEGFFLAGRGVTKHAGGPVGAEDVPAVLRLGEFHFEPGDVARIGPGNLHALNRMHSGGQVPTGLITARNAFEPTGLKPDETTRILHTGAFIINAESTRRIGPENLARLVGMHNGGTAPPAIAPPPTVLAGMATARGPSAPRTTLGVGKPLLTPPSVVKLHTGGPVSIVRSASLPTLHVGGAVPIVNVSTEAPELRTTSFSLDRHTSETRRLLMQTFSASVPTVHLGGGIPGIPLALPRSPGRPGTPGWAQSPSPVAVAVMHAGGIIPDITITTPGQPAGLRALGGAYQSYGALQAPVAVARVNLAPGAWGPGPRWQRGDSRRDGRRGSGSRSGIKSHAGGPIPGLMPDLIPDFAAANGLDMLAVRPTLIKVAEEGPEHVRVTPGAIRPATVNDGLLGRILNHLDALTLAVRTSQERPQVVENNTFNKAESPEEIARKMRWLRASTPSYLRH